VTDTDSGSTDSSSESSTTDSEQDSSDIYDYWAEFRRTERVGVSGGRVRRLAGEQVRGRELVLRDPKRFSSRVNADTMGPVMGTVILAMDGEEHRRYRNLVAHAFRPSALARWESELIAPTIHRLIDGLRRRAGAGPRGGDHQPIPGPGHR